MPKPIPTPEHMVPIVAAILASGRPSIPAEKDKPHHEMNVMAQRYRQYFRMLSRNPEEPQDEE